MDVVHEPWCSTDQHGPENDTCTSTPADVHGITTWLTAEPGERPHLILGDVDLTEDGLTAVRDHLDEQIITIRKGSQRQPAQAG